MDLSSSISSWNETGDTPPADWKFDSIDPVNDENSIDVTTNILKNWEPKTAFQKPLIGPHSLKHKPMVSIHQKRKELVKEKQLKKGQAASQIQRWYRGYRGIQMTSVSCAVLQNCQDSCSLL